MELCLTEDLLMTCVDFFSLCIECKTK